MAFWDLLKVASIPILEVLIISALGAFMATSYCNNLLSADTRKSLNKIVFVVFAPSLTFASLARTVTLQDIISWWFMPINVGIIFMLGAVLGWIVVKILKPSPKLEGLIIATCSSGNLGNLPIVVVPTMCDEKGNPFGARSTCRSHGLSYASFSMALGGVYMWTHTYHLIKSSALKFREIQAAEEASRKPNSDLNEGLRIHLLTGEEMGDVSTAVTESAKYDRESGNQIIDDQCSSQFSENKSILQKIIDFLREGLKELMAPPTIGAILGFVFGATTWLRNLIVGEAAPLRVIQDSVQLLGEGTIPSMTLLLGGNLTEGLRSSKVKPEIILLIILSKFIIMPIVGIYIVKLAGDIGILPRDPLFHFVLMVQYTLPPAMAMSTMSQLFGVGQEECSVLLLWTYIAAAIALTGWSTVFMWMLS